MATFLHKPTGKRFLFIHIPRTGGRFVEANFLRLNDIWWDDDWEKFGIEKMFQPVHGIELGHFHREYYLKYLDCKDIPHFSIVRNPIHRFISASLYLRRFYEEISGWSPIQKDMEDNFHQMLDNYVRMIPEARNWYRPQIDFMTDDTHIWKFENGLGAEYFSWLSGIVGVDLVYDDNVDYIKQPDEHRKLELTGKLLHNLVRFYKQDLDAFYPNHEYTKLAASLQ